MPANKMVVTDQTKEKLPGIKDGRRTQQELESVDKKTLKNVFGSDDPKFCMSAIQWLNSALPASLRKDESQFDATIQMLRAIAPKDEMEAMLAGQMIASHFCSLEMARRTQNTDQTLPSLTQYGNLTNKFMRTFCAQLETLNKSRNGGKQTIQVQHVTVENGGQAVVGNVKTGGG